MKSKEKVFFNKQEEHSTVKLLVLKEYLKLWIRKVTLNSFNKSHSCLIADTFAGTGIYEDGKLGSPFLIINEAEDFIKQAINNNMNLPTIYLVFTEADINNYTKLKNNISSYFNQEIIDNRFNTINSNNKLKIYISNKKHEEFISNITNEIDKMIPALFFIDPFKWKIPFDLNKKIFEKYNNVEIIYNLMTEELSRFIESDKIENAVKLLFGLDDITDLINKIKGTADKERIDIITKYYRNQLENAGAKHTLNFDIQRENGHFKMSLIYATKNKNGFDSMKEVLNLLSSKNTNQFVYLIDKHINQECLELYPKDEIIITELASYIYDNYKSKHVKSKEVKEKVKEHPYIPSKYFTKAMNILYDTHKIYSVIKFDGAIAKKHSYPDDSIITFK